MKETWQLIETTINENPAPIQNENVRYEFNLTGDNACEKQLILSNGTAKITDDTTTKADCKLTLSSKDFMKLLAGDLNSTTAFMFGKLKVDGSIGLALKLEGLLKEYRF
ncbi:SCP2 sterol-binding domain-containing protein [Psychrobacillus sp. INOP01]|uniref:SCP2 sterol-binding domain-containing protein n=1 Tax=Psychrobacillus sp. INOP01 TaxID=2829187 RepID=UPI001BA756B0|nr:SCP2 sterol-binding domain-containing protein [Psychrobacillus sp. INOP01]QUG40800.1 SCP2 sterol-binding domain-containing protein [Psychrobacillus sp. INOP01]